MADSKLIWASTRAEDGGVFYRNALGTAMPELADAPWDDLETDGWVDHGWIGDDGITNSIKRDITEHQAFGGDVVKVTFNKYTEQLKVTCLESNQVVLETVFGADNVTLDESSGHRQLTVNHSSLAPERYAWCARVIDGDKTRLIRVEEGQLQTIEDVVHQNKNLVKYTLVIQCYKPDDDTDAVSELIDEADVPAGSA